MKIADRHYTYRVAVSMIGYTGTLWLAKIAIDRHHVNGLLAVLLAVLPGLCIAGVFWALARLLVETTDEFQRLLLVRKILVASGLAMTVMTIWTFLAGFKLVGPVDGIYLVVVFFIGLLVGSIYNRITLGTTSC